MQSQINSEKHRTRLQPTKSAFQVTLLGLSRKINIFQSKQQIKRRPLHSGHRL